MAAVYFLSFHSSFRFILPLTPACTVWRTFFSNFRRWNASSSTIYPHCPPSMLLPAAVYFPFISFTFCFIASLPDSHTLFPASAQPQKDPWLLFSSDPRFPWPRAWLRRPINGLERRWQLRDVRLVLLIAARGGASSCACSENSTARARESQLLFSFLSAAFCFLTWAFSFFALCFRLFVFLSFVFIAAWERFFSAENFSLFAICAIFVGDSAALLYGRLRNFWAEER